MSFAAHLERVARRIGVNVLAIELHHTQRQHPRSRGSGIFHHDAEARPSAGGVRSAGEDGTVESLTRPREQRAFLCRLSPDRALGSVEEADAFLQDRGLLTRTADCALPSLWGVP